MATTALMPLDPAPQQTNRVLTIRANLLPPEISVGRNARRMRGGVVVAMVVVLGLLGAWFAYAYHQKNLAGADLTDVTQQVNTVRSNETKYQEVTKVKAQNELIATQLKTLLADDLVWSDVLDDLQSTASKNGVTITSIAAIAADKQSTSANLPSTSGETTVFTLTIGGTAPDKKTIAKYIDALTSVDNVANPYLTAATQGDTGSVSFLANADVTSDALCGRWTRTCPTGGK
jgi:hypothetical protein